MSPVKVFSLLQKYIGDNLIPKINQLAIFPETVHYRN